MSEGPKTMTPADMASEKKVQWKYLDNQLQAAVRQVDTKLNNDIAIMKAKAESQKQQYLMSVDLETSRAEAQMRHAATAERMRMMQSCEGQKAAIEQGILNQMMLYEKARSEEDLKRAQEDMVKHAEDMQSKLNVEVGRLVTNRDDPHFTFDETTGMLVPPGVPLPHIRGPDLGNLNSIAQHAGGLDLRRMPPPLQAHSQPGSPAHSQRGTSN